MNQELKNNSYINEHFPWYFNYMSNFFEIPLVNASPIANNDNAITSEDTPVVIDVLANDTDAEGDTIFIVSTSNASNGTVQIVGGKLVYTPNADYWGADSIRYTISDGNGGVSSAFVNVDITPSNDSPQAVEDNAVSYGSAVTIDVLANDIDADGDPIQLNGVTNGSNGIAVIDNGMVTYVPNAGFIGTDNFTYTISDGNGGNNQGTVYVEVKEQPQDWKIDMRSYDVYGIGGHTYLQFWDSNGNLVAEISAGPEGSPRRIVDIDHEIIPGTVTNRSDETDPFVELFCGPMDEFNALLNTALEAVHYINDQQLPYFALPLNLDGSFYNSNSAANTVLDAMLDTGFISTTDVENAKDFHNGLYLIGTPGNDKDMFQGDNWSPNIDDGGDVIGSIVSLTADSKKSNIIGTEGDDILTGDNKANYILGNDGDDILIGLQGNDYLDGSDGDDILSGGFGSDYLAGRDGNDTILGGFGADSILGGNDADTLTGGFGNDRFVYSNIGESIDTARDVITDFTQGADVLDFVSLAFYGIDDFTDVSVSNDGVNTFVSDNNSNFEIELSGVIALNDSDFTWV